MDTTDSTQAQDIIRCQLCKGKSTKSAVEVVCKTCHINLCNDCLATHVTANLSVKHDIVGYSFGNSEFTSIPCTIHTDWRCDLHCQDCDSHVCAKCLASGSHKNHDVIEISEVYKTYLKIIKADTEEMQTKIEPTFKEIDEEVTNITKEVPHGYEKVTESILTQGKEWHRVVDIIIQKTISKAEDMKSQDLSMLENLQTEIRNPFSLVQKAIKSNQDILKSKDETKMRNYKSRNEVFRRVPARFSLSQPWFQPNNLDEDQIFRMFGELFPSIRMEIPAFTIELSPDEPLLCKLQQNDVPKLMQILNTGLTEAYSLSCVPNTDQVYVRGNSKIIKCLDTKGNTTNEVETKSGNVPYDLIVTSSGKLIYTDPGNRSTCVVDLNNKKIEETQQQFCWIPKAVCCTSNNNILVSMKTDDGQQSKVVRYEGLVIKQEIQFDEKGNPLYSHPCFITENKNLQICVSDWNTVIVTDQKGYLIFIYKGNLTSTRKKLAFSPVGIASDILCQILVIDQYNKVIHIIDKNGDFVKLIDNCDLVRPHALSVASDGTLFVSERSTGKIKIIKYLK